MNISLKKDKFRRDRGGSSRFLIIMCAACKSILTQYQKDGPGELKRMYLDRISDSIMTEKGKNYCCPSCEQIIGIFIIYKKETRPAIRINKGSILKKITK